ncbi:MAG: CoA transferase, partial [Vicinamibacterales bacterium]
MTGPLAGRRIIDLSQEIAGPFCTKLLAAFGAEVIKVEPPDGDSARYLPPFLGDEPGPERSGLFAYLNTGKRIVVQDHEEPEGRGAIHRHVETADV